MVKKFVTIVNTPKGFLWIEMGSYYKTLESAKKAVLRDAKNIAKMYGRVATVFTIEG